MLDAVQFAPSADIYALGVVLWEMAHRVIAGVYARPYEVARSSRPLLGSPRCVVRSIRI